MLSTPRFPGLCSLSFALLLTTTLATTLQAEDLPGAVDFADELRGDINAAVAAKESDYVPRTKHLAADGSASYTNRLVLESSPYLLQHAHNPVNWYPWGRCGFYRRQGGEQASPFERWLFNLSLVPCDGG